MEIISITNPNLFQDLILATDSHINTVMRKIYNGEFADGSVTIKIDLSAVKEELEVPRGVGDFIIKEYKSPRIKYSVNSSLKQSFKNENSVNTKGLMVELFGNDVRVGKVEDNQISFFEE